MTGDSSADGGPVGYEGTGGAAGRPPESPRARFVAALAVRRNAAAGLVVGVAVAAAVYWVFVVEPAETLYSPVLYVLLSVTVALATAAVVAFALTLLQAALLWRRLDDVER